MPGDVGAVVFRAAEQLYFLPATVALRVAPVPQIGRVPGAPVDIVGLALVDGDMVAVVSVGDVRTSMLIVQYMGERIALVGVEVVASGRFESVHDRVLHVGEHARLFDISAVIARVRDTRWAV
jgi:hypothetical protein